MTFDTTDKPRCPADRRPGDEPYYIDSECEECGGSLIYYKLAHGHVDSVEDVDWYDEFGCSDCCDGIYMDVPAGVIT